MAFRPPAPALLLALTALLAGCADSFDGKTISVKQEAEVADANGPVGKTGECDGDGSLSYTVTRRAGTVRILVSDPSGTLVFDSGTLDAAPEGFLSVSLTEVEGNPGEWSVAVERDGFTGSYAVTVAC